MNIIIFGLLLVLIFILFIAAEYLDVVLHVIAFGILFMLGVVIFTAGLQYKVGETIQTNYTYQPSPLNTSINSSIETRQGIYATYNEGMYHLIGILLCAASVGGFALVYVHYGRKRND